MTTTTKVIIASIIGVGVGYFVSGQVRSTSPQLQTGRVCNDSPVCCDSATFCALTVNELEHYVSNYQNFNWSRTSRFFSEGYADYDCQTKSEFLDFLDNQSPKRTLYSIPPQELTHNLFDAGLMDISIADMENYICAIKNNVIHRNSREGKCCPTPEILRFYYIRYDGPEGRNSRIYQPYDTTFDYKHSLAIVPVCVMEDSSKVECLGDDDFYSSSLIWAPQPKCEKSLIANHNQICPPLLGWGESTVLQRVYGNESLYGINENTGKPCIVRGSVNPCGMDPTTRVDCIPQSQVTIP